MFGYMWFYFWRFGYISGHVLYIHAPSICTPTSMCLNGYIASVKGNSGNWPYIRRGQAYEHGDREGASWARIGSHGSHLGHMEPHGIPMGPHGTPWGSHGGPVGLNGVLCRGGVPIGTHDFFWVPMGF